AEDQTGRCEHEEEAAADGAIRQALDAEKRRVVMALEHRESSEPANTTETDEQRLERRPAGGLTLRDRKDDGSEACGRERRSAQVEPAPARLLRIGGHDLH